MIDENEACVWASKAHKHVIINLNQIFCTTWKLATQNIYMFNDVFKLRVLWPASLKQLTNNTKSSHTKTKEKKI